jgi:hypothetical protein
MHETAKAWLNYYVARGGQRAGLICKKSKGQLEDANRAAWKAAGFEQVGRDVARHSYASYELQRSGSLTETIKGDGNQTCRFL